MTSKSAPMTDTETSDWPTPEMLKAGMDDLGWWVEPYEAPRESGVPVDSDMSAEDAAKINAMQMEVVESAFRAMLAAAPKPQGDDLEPVAWQHRLFFEDTGKWSDWRDGPSPFAVANKFEKRALVPASALQSLKAERETRSIGFSRLAMNS